MTAPLASAPPVRRPVGLWRRVVALAKEGRSVGEIAHYCDVGMPYVRATCRRKGVPLKGKRAWKNG